MELNDPFQRLSSLRDRLGATIKNKSFNQEIEPFKEIKRLLESEGIEVERADIHSIGPYLTYKGEVLAILYILNSNSSSIDLHDNNPSLSTPKFHFTWCKTLQKMTEYKRFDRYVLSRSKSNIFRVEALEREDNEIKKHGERHMLEGIRLFPCQNCLKELNYKGFEMRQPKIERHHQVESFSIGEYIEENEGNLTVMKHLPKTRAEDAKGGSYTIDFPEISRALREKNNWKCSKCEVNMLEKKSGLHVHHINGVKSDNNHKNLMVLCALCHQSIDSFHSTMHVSQSIRSFIEKNRER